MDDNLDLLDDFLQHTEPAVDNADTSGAWDLDLSPEEEQQLQAALEASHQDFQGANLELGSSSSLPPALSFSDMVAPTSTSFPPSSQLQTFNKGKQCTQEAAIEPRLTMQLSDTYKAMQIL